MSIKQKHRTGRVVFGDASVSVWEEGLGSTFEERAKWERAFKREVFANIIQQLHRIGWQVKPWDQASDYKPIALNHRTCAKGDLKGELRISGRCIDFEMWQGINTPNRPDYGGRYEHNKEAVMPYLLRLEIERTRRRIRDYLCNIFDGYRFDNSRVTRMSELSPNGVTAVQYIEASYQESWHFKGDTNTYPISNSNRKAAFGGLLEHGQRVWFFDYKGRTCTGIAYYNINNMWWVVSGRYGLNNKSAGELLTSCPEDPRDKRNEWLRNKRLQEDLAKAVKVMDFERAATLKLIIWPNAEPLFLLRKGDLYHRPNFCGYTANPVEAGKFTRHQLRGITNTDEQIVPVAEA